METPKAKEIMKRYLEDNSRHLKTFLDWYFARRKNNHHVLIEVCEELKKLDCECYVSKSDYKDERVDIVYVFKSDKRVVFGFAEVPYRWYVGGDYSHGRFNDRENHGFNFLYEVSEIIDRMETAKSSDLWMKDAKSHIKL